MVTGQFSIALQQAEFHDHRQANLILVMAVDYLVMVFDHLVIVLEHMVMILDNLVMVWVMVMDHLVRVPNLTSKIKRVWEVDQPWTTWSGQGP